MSGRKRKRIRVCVVVEMIFMLVIQGNHLVISSTPEASGRKLNITATEGNRSLTAYTCDGHELTIRCKENETIHIEYANYGRLTNNICNTSGNGLFTKCSSNNSTSIVNSRCTGKSSCTVLAKVEDFGDPCKGTSKYLGVIHHCYPATEGNRSLTAYACEESVLTITCKENESIHIAYANYGRLTNNICNDKTHWRTNCSSNNSLSNVHSRCSGKSNCTVKASNDIFGDPCSGTFKYLGVIHRCYPEDMTTSGTNSITSSMKRESMTTVSPYNGPKCGAERKRNVNWTDTHANSIANLPCPNNINLNNAKRTCGSQAKWNSVPDLSECVSEEMLLLQRKLENLTISFSLDGVHELMDGLANVSQGEDLYGGDLVLLADVMVKAIDLTTERKSPMNVTDAQRINEVVIDTTSNLLRPEVNDTWMDLPKINQSVTATRLLCSVESISAVLANSTDEELNFTRTVHGLDVLVDVTAAAETSEAQSSNTTQMSPAELSAAFTISNQADSAMLSLEDIMPENGAGLGRVTFALFDGIAQWLHLNDSAMKSPSDTTTTADLKSSSSEATPKVIVNTRVMSISIVSRSENDTGLKQPVQYTLEHKKKKKNDSDPACVFWKYSKETFEGHWSKEGCLNVSSNSTHTICECNHLTNFAVLMSVSGDEMLPEHAFALFVITYIGCTISIICLALAFITFCWFKGLQCDRNTIHKNLVLCLFISEVIFLLGIAQNKQRELCAVVTGFLHYFFLASFSWMCLEGVQIYVLFIEVFEAEKSRLKWYYPSAYGVPALIVIISAAVTWAQGNRYAAEEYCWLTTKNGLIWAFVGPVTAIIAVNWVMLGVAIHTMYKHTSTATSWKQKSRIQTIRSFVRGAILLMILLGSTWTFGFLHINQSSLFMAYIFTILNSLQGLFIFIFHCLINEKVRKEYRRCIQRCTWLPEDVRVKHGGLSGSASVSTTPNQSNSSGVPMFFRMLKNRKRDNSLSSSSFQKSSNDSTKKEGSSSSSAFSHKVKRHASSTSESAMLTDSSGIQSSDYLYDHDESHVDENVFSGPDMVEKSTMKNPPS